MENEVSSVNNTKNRKKILIILFLTILFFSIIAIMVSGVDVWDRPTVNYTQISANFTLQFNYLNTKIDNETQARINNDTYIINLFNASIQNIYGILIGVNSDIQDLQQNITTLQSEINSINYDLVGINGNLTTLGNAISSVNNTVNSNYNYTLYLIQEVNLSSKIKKNIYTTTILVTNGSGQIVTSHIPNALLTTIRVSGTGNYNFELVENATLFYIDKSRINHNQNWSIEKNYALNNSVIATISNANIDGNYNMSLEYLTNWN